MSQIIHYIALLFIVFIIAEIRNVLLAEEPFQPQQISIWEETQPPGNMSIFFINSSK